MRFWALTLGAALFLSACNEVGLRELSRPGQGPDEFLVLPNKPLERPENLAALPTPTPGGVNRSDAQPVAEGIAALGGSAAATSTGGIPGADATLVAQVSRFGGTPDIRSQLAAEDAKFRKRQARFANIRLFPVDRYESAYSRQALDAQAINDSFERAGIKTPTAPPR